MNMNYLFGPLFFSLVLASTFDLILNFEVFGFTVRLAHFLGLAFIIAVISQRKDEINKLINPVVYALAAYLAAAAASVMFSSFFYKSIGYLLWAMYDALLFGAIALYAVKERPSRVVFYFLSASVAVCAFGIMQLYAPRLGLRPLFVTQWMGDIPRINAFFYEPSYFVFFAVQGLSIAGAVFILRERFSLPCLISSLVIGTSIILSSSRSGWVAMAVVFIVFAAVSYARGRMPRYAIMVFLLAIISGSNTALLQRLNASVPELAEHTSQPGYWKVYAQMAQKALDPDEASSSMPRKEGLLTALKVFGSAPVLGVGIGGYGGYIKRNPEIFRNQKGDAYAITTPNLWAEVLAETGVFGAGALVLMLSALFASGAKALRARPEGSAYLSGCLLGVFIIFGVSYQFCQTLFRLDTWILMGICFGFIIGSHETSANIKTAYAEIPFGHKKPAATHSM